LVLSTSASQKPEDLDVPRENLSDCLGGERHAEERREDAKVHHAQRANEHFLISKVLDEVSVQEGADDAASDTSPQQR